MPHVARLGPEGLFWLLFGVNGRSANGIRIRPYHGCCIGRGGQQQRGKLLAGWTPSAAAAGDGGTVSSSLKYLPAQGLKSTAETKINRHRRVAVGQQGGKLTPSAGMLQCVEMLTTHSRSCKKALIITRLSRVRWANGSTTEPTEVSGKTPRNFCGVWIQLCRKCLLPGLASRGSVGEERGFQVASKVLGDQCNPWKGRITIVLEAKTRIGETCCRRGSVFTGKMILAFDVSKKPANSDSVMMSVGSW